jgi:hypothetical protein
MPVEDDRHPVSGCPMMGHHVERQGQTMRFEIAKSRSKKEPFFWRLVANNGQTLAT